MSLEDLQRTAEVCRKHDILCVSDETYADIYDTTPPHSILECGLKNVLAIHSLSKRSGLTGYRSGFIAGDPDVMSRLRRFRANPGLVPQTFVNAAAQVAWADDAHVQKRREIFAEKKRLFIRFFDEMGWEFLGREATLYLWVRAPKGSAEDWALELLEEGIVVSPGSMFGLTDSGALYIRLAMVPSLQKCQRAIEIWRKSLNRQNH